MRKLIICPIFFFLLTSPLLAADDKIDPSTYICAELTASSVDGVPPIYESLQIDGYAAAKTDEVVADPKAVSDIFNVVYDACSAMPTDKVIDHWQNVRGKYPLPQDGEWRADRTKCKDFIENSDDGSGFVIWLDGYYRGKNSKTESILTDQKTFDKFMEACKKKPASLMLDVLAASAK